MLLLVIQLTEIKLSLDLWVIYLIKDRGIYLLEM